MLSQEALAQIDQEARKYPAEQRQSVVMSALRIAQAELGWLSRETIAFVADYLDMPAIAVYEVATFYNMYDLEPVGRHKLTLCTNLPCQLQGADRIAEHLKARMGIDFNETTADGRFTLKEGECMGACGSGPLCLHNNHRMHTHLTPESVDKLMDELK
ncbi:MAG TPA: NADH-quinone oxidoreductase subunit NuoE [Thiobacillaceae bacterium]|nr:NADH-quinone oxidoreductase subunit NuoE [Thiobacillaceae bacterium]HNU63955.1 NADH-quinone oxidoreductase subunit NuoE [Thiobacillaceae bacterium]